MLMYSLGKVKLVTGRIISLPKPLTRSLNVRRLRGSGLIYIYISIRLCYLFSKVDHKFIIKIVKYFIILDMYF